MSSYQMPYGSGADFLWMLSRHVWSDLLWHATPDSTHIPHSLASMFTEATFSTMSVCLIYLVRNLIPLSLSDFCHVWSSFWRSLNLLLFGVSFMTLCLTYKYFLPEGCVVKSSLYHGDHVYFLYLTNMYDIYLSCVMRHWSIQVVLKLGSMD